ncbi:MAG: trigger factor [Candidatus Beckwithbacteria bacterium]|nr:trigger factor [Candidatus Beckwithbacteria bacterium]
MTKLTWLPKKTFELEFSLPWEEVKTTYDKVLNDLVKEVKIEGFRQGKAPKTLVEKNVDKGKLYGEVINQLLPLSYAKLIAEHKLRPAVSPKITIISAEENKPWQFKATSCELPEIKLGDYQKICHGALATAKFWTPDKGKIDAKKDKELTQTQKLNLISKALLEETKIDLSDLLINDERDRLLSRLLDQIQKLGLNLDQYAVSNNKTVAQIRQEYQATATNTLKLELILQAIAEDRKFKVEDKEVDQMISAAGDEKLKKELNTPTQRAYIGSILRKRQAIDYLIGL